MIALQNGIINNFAGHLDENSHVYSEKKIFGCQLTILKCRQDSRKTFFFYKKKELQQYVSKIGIIIRE